MTSIPYLNSPVPPTTKIDLPAKQTKRASLAESVANVIVGAGIAFANQLLVFWILSISISIRDNVLITILFTAVSMARSFIIRRIFETLRVKGLLP